TLVARQAYTGAPPIVRELIELHIRSQKSGDGRLFLLAKALEIVGAFFRGDGSRASRNAGIEAEIRTTGTDNHLTQPVAWLVDIANERLDVRHAWNRDSPGLVLHPRMTTQERNDFTRNADLLIRAFICARLGLPVPLVGVGDTEPPKTGTWKG